MFWYDRDKHWKDVLHMKIGNIVWTSVEDNVINEKEEYKTIRLHGFNYRIFEEE